MNSNNEYPSLLDPQFDQKRAAIDRSRRFWSTLTITLGAIFVLAVTSAIWCFFVNTLFINTEPYHWNDLVYTAKLDSVGNVYYEKGRNDGGYDIWTKLIVWGVGIGWWGFATVTYYLSQVGVLPRGPKLN